MALGGTSQANLNSNLKVSSVSLVISLASRSASFLILKKIPNASDNFKISQYKRTKNYAIRVRISRDVVSGVFVRNWGAQTLVQLEVSLSSSEVQA